MSSESRREKPLVLIVDDDLATRELLTSYLEPEGYATVMVSSGLAALGEARRLLPDLIVMDVLMPGPGGHQTLLMLSNAPESSKIPAIIVSAISPGISAQCLR